MPVPKLSSNEAAAAKKCFPSEYDFEDRIGCELRRASVLAIAPSHPQAQLNPLRWSGRVRILLPVAAKIALPIAGRIGGSVGSPSPVGA